VDADAEASYLIGLEEVEAFLADDVNDVEALAVRFQHASSAFVCDTAIARILKSKQSQSCLLLLYI
jgi:hypothetical protein